MVLGLAEVSIIAAGVKTVKRRRAATHDEPSELS